MKRMLATLGPLALVLVAGLPSAGAQSIPATPVATQENVRHVANVPGATGGHSVVEGNRLYVGAYGLGFRIFDISNPRSPRQIGQYIPGPHPDSNNTVDLGVRADAVPDAAVFGGRHIATLNGTSRRPNAAAGGVTVRGTQQTEFLDVTNPANPVLLHRFNGPVTDGNTFGEAHNGDILDARKLWVPSGGRDSNILRIFDLSPVLQSPPQAPKLLARADPFNLWRDSPYRQNTGKPIGVNPSGSHTHDVELYGGVTVLLPEWEWVDQDEDGIPEPTYAQKDIMLMAVSTDYAVDGKGANNGSVYVVDISNPADPVVINRWQNPNDAGDHIRYLHEVQFLHGDFSTMIVTDEDLHSGCEGGRLYTVRISPDLMDATKLAEWAIGSAQADTPTCLGSHVFSSHDRHVFMGAYTAGLQVLDLTNPAQPKRAGRYIPEGANSWGALYHAGVIYVGDFGGRGLDVFEFIKDPVAKAFVKAANPGTRTTGGVAERGCRAPINDPYGPTNGTDGIIVPIPEWARDGKHTLKALGSSSAPYDLDIWFHTGTNCTSMGYPGGVDGTDASEPIPEEATMASIDLYTGAAQWVYATIVKTG